MPLESRLYCQCVQSSNRSSSSSSVRLNGAIFTMFIAECETVYMHTSFAFLNLFLLLLLVELLILSFSLPLAPVLSGIILHQKLCG